MDGQRGGGGRGGGQRGGRGGRGGGGGGQGGQGGQGGGGYQGGGGGRGAQGGQGGGGGGSYQGGGRGGQGGGGRGGQDGGGRGGYGGGERRGGGGGYQGGGGERGRGGGGYRGGQGGGERGRGGGGGGRGGGGGFGGGNYQQRDAGVGMVAQQMGRMQLEPREFIDMAVAKEIAITRPEQVKGSKKGKDGTEVDLVSNFFPLQTMKEWDIFQYRVDFTPDIPDTRIKKSLVAREKAKIGGNCFDGSMMFTVKRLAVTEIVTKLDNSEEVIQITIREVGIMSRTDQRFLQIYNIILNRAMSRLNLSQLGRNYYDSRAAIEVANHNIELWPGYMTSIRQHEQNILLNVEIGYKFLRMDTVRHLFDKCQQDRTRMVNASVGQIIITDYNNTTYRVDRIDFDQTPMSTFRKGDQDITYMDYYRSRYNITIKDPRQPLLVSKAKARQIRGGSPEEFFLIPELCRLTGLDDQMRNDKRMMRDLAQFTRVDPRARQQRLGDFSRRMASSAEAQQSFAEFGLSLGQNLVKLKGRVLPPERVFFQGDKPYVADRADWTGPAQKARLYSTRTPLNNWFVLTPSRCRPETENFIGQLERVSKGLGIQFGRPEIVELPNDRPPEYVRELERVCQKDPQMLMCVVSNDSADRYSAIKKALSVHRSVLSQVMLSRTVGEQNPSKLLSVATKVMIQVNTKMGNAPWKVAIPLKGMMVIGFDVCHDTRDRSRSFAAFIASMDQARSDVYYSAAAAHRNGEELSNSFGQMTVKAIECYMRTHNELPERILIYRDGVGDGQLQFVIDHELKQLKQVVQGIYGERVPKMAFVVVTKRINARFFAGDQNPRAGTVVDDVITLPERYDFFLVSQNVNQGTATPTNYNVIYDTMGLSPDRMQMLTHKLCHMYYNWSGTVRVPNVCQYAHKLSLLVGQYFHEEPNPQLAEKLYFL